MPMKGEEKQFEREKMEKLKRMKGK